LPGFAVQVTCTLAGMATVSVTRRFEWFGLTRRTMIEVDGERVGGVWVSSELKIEVSAGPHSFRAFMAWVGSRPLEVDVRQDGATTLGVRAPYGNATLATARFRPVGPQAQLAKPNEGLEIWEYPSASD
jgi:hypothetical protein